MEMVKCYFCEKPSIFNTTTELNEHIVKDHIQNTSKGTTDNKNLLYLFATGISCFYCETKLYSYRHINEHLSYEHNVHIELEELVFFIPDEFIAWKKEMEQRTLAKYEEYICPVSLVPTRKIPKKTFYRCSNATRICNIDNKKDFVCPSSLETYMDGNVLKVSFWRSHLCTSHISNYDMPSTSANENVNEVHNDTLRTLKSKDGTPNNVEVTPELNQGEKMMPHSTVSQSLKDVFSNFPLDENEYSEEQSSTLELFQPSSSYSTQNQTQVSQPNIYTANRQNEVSKLSNETVPLKEPPLNINLNGSNQREVSKEKQKCRKDMLEKLTQRVIRTDLTSIDPCFNRTLDKVIPFLNQLLDKHDLATCLKAGGKTPFIYYPSSDDESMSEPEENFANEGAVSSTQFTNGELHVWCCSKKHKATSSDTCEQVKPKKIRLIRSCNSCESDGENFYSNKRPFGVAENVNNNELFTHSGFDHTYTKATFCEF